MAYATVENLILCGSIVLISMIFFDLIVMCKCTCVQRLFGRGWTRVRYTLRDVGNISWDNDSLISLTK